MSNYINPVRDIFIKFLFGSEENKDLLLSFINSVLEDADFPKIVKVYLKNPFNYKEFSVDKESILDVKAEDEEGTIFNIEVQANDLMYFKNRSLYYWARIYSGQLKNAEIYEELNPVVSINLIDGIMFNQLKNCHTCFLLTEKKNPEFVLSNHLFMHFIEIKKIQNIPLKKALNQWINYFINEGRETNMKILLKDDPIMEKAHNVYKRFTEDEKLREMYEAREKFRRDLASQMHVSEQRGIEKGIKKGREEGRKEGKKENKIETAKAMLAEGLDTDLIIKITQLAQEVIESLQIRG